MPWAVSHWALQKSPLLLSPGVGSSECWCVSSQLLLRQITTDSWHKMTHGFPYSSRGGRSKNSPWAKIGCQRGCSLRRLQRRPALPPFPASGGFPNALACEPFLYYHSNLCFCPHFTLSPLNSDLSSIPVLRTTWIIQDARPISGPLTYSHLPSPICRAIQPRTSSGAVQLTTLGFPVPSLSHVSRRRT